ncbi:MAG TPA: ABC transporter permease [Puia sp.]|nr:ABC transporter permease [Puia sp.]
MNGHVVGGALIPKSELKKTAMLGNNWKIALRYMSRHKTYSFINIVGLSVGLAVSLLIGLWIEDEYSYNRSFDYYDRIAIVIRQFNYNTMRINLPGSPYAMRDELLSRCGDDLRSVVMATANDGRRFRMDYGDNHYLESGRFMDPEGAEMFSLRMLKGTRGGLKEPGAILLSKSLSKAIFGDADPMGKGIRIDGTMNARVTGVYDDFPHNSHFSNNYFIASMEMYLEANPDFKAAPNPWLNHDNLDAYVLLADHADMAKVSARMSNIRKERLSTADYKPLEMVDYLHPMPRWRLYSNFENATGYAVREKIEYVRLLGLVCILVLILACINFINLSTARSERRAKEVGIRKTIGSMRSHLVQQFLFESQFAVVIAFALALLWLGLIMPPFNALVGKQISIPWGSPVFWIGSLFFIMATGLLAGLYPAVYLSGFQPAKVLKGVFRAGPLASLPRRILVVFQFSVSTALIICTMVIDRQIQFAATRPIGYERGGLLMINMTPDIRKNYTVIGEELKRSRTILGMAGSQNTTVDYNVDNDSIDWVGKNPNLNVDWAVSKVTYDYGRTIGWQVIEGRDFSRDFPTDSTGLILNEAAVKQTGFDNPVGMTIKFRGKPFHVVGVIRNIIFESPYLLGSSPAAFHMAEGDNIVTTLRLNPQRSVQSALAEVQQVFKRYNPNYPFDYRFADQAYAKKFDEEQQIGTLSGFFTFLAIFISCLGLFGMIAFVAEQRRKEIGIRKVLGASEFSLWQMLSKDFVKLVSLSLVFAVPASYYYMRGWLQQYEYRYTISWVIFVVAGSGALLVALLTVSYQAIRAAKANPVIALKSE